ARERLARHQAVSLRLPVDLSGTSNPIEIEFSSERYVKTIQGHVAGVIDGIGALLESNDLDSSAVDGLLLAGDSAAGFSVANIGAGASLDKVSRVEDQAIAFGAVVHALEGAGRGLTAPSRRLMLRPLHRPALRPVAAEASEQQGAAQFSRVTRLAQAPAAP